MNDAAGKTAWGRDGIAGRGAWPCAAARLTLAVALLALADPVLGQDVGGGAGETDGLIRRVFKGIIAPMVDGGHRLAQGGVVLLAALGLVAVVTRLIRQLGSSEGAGSAFREMMLTMLRYSLAGVALTLWPTILALFVMLAMALGATITNVEVRPPASPDIDIEFPIRDYTNDDVPSLEEASRWDGEQLADRLVDSIIGRSIVDTLEALRAMRLMFSIKAQVVNLYFLSKGEFDQVGFFREQLRRYRELPDPPDGRKNITDFLYQVHEDLQEVLDEETSFDWFAPIESTLSALLYIFLTIYAYIKLIILIFFGAFILLAVVKYLAVIAIGLAVLYLIAPLAIVLAPANPEYARRMVSTMLASGTQLAVASGVVALLVGATEYVMLSSFFSPHVVDIHVIVAVKLLSLIAFFTIPRIMTTVGQVFEGGFNALLAAATDVSGAVQRIVRALSTAGGAAYAGGRYATQMARGDASRPATMPPPGAPSPPPISPKGDGPSGWMGEGTWGVGGGAPHGDGGVAKGSGHGGEPKDRAVGEMAAMLNEYVQRGVNPEGLFYAALHAGIPRETLEEAVRASGRQDFLFALELAEERLNEGAGGREQGGGRDRTAAVRPIDVAELLRRQDAMGSAEEGAGRGETLRPGEARTIEAEDEFRAALARGSDSEEIKEMVRRWTGEIGKEATATALARAILRGVRRSDAVSESFGRDKVEAGLGGGLGTTEARRHPTSVGAKS